MNFPPKTILVSYTMKGILANSNPPYQAVFWTSYNVPDYTGQYSNYFGQFVPGTIKVASGPTGINGPVTYNAPGGPASGDLDGYYPNPKVDGLQGIPISDVAPILDQQLVFNGTEWIPLTTTSSANTYTVINVKAYGATGDGITNDTIAIQTAINTAILAGGGTVYFPTGIYCIASTLNIQRIGSQYPVGVMLQGASMGLFVQNSSYPASTIRWIGATGGDSAILYCWQYSSGAITNLSFDGNNKADYCVWMQTLSTDTNPVNNINCSNLYYSGANKYNLLLGELDSSTYEGGNVSQIIHTNCYFANGPVNTISHIRHNTYNGLKNSFVSCQFYGNGGVGPNMAPYHACYMTKGSAEFHDCVGDALGTVDFLMDDSPYGPPGDLLITGYEGQTRSMLWASAPYGNQCDRSTVLINCYMDDITNSNTDGYYISWGIRGAPLVLDGCVTYSQTIAKGNIVISNPLAIIDSRGTAFIGGASEITGVGFQGYVEMVNGTYEDGYFNYYTLNTQNQMDSWGICHQSNTSAVVTGSGASFSTINNAEYFQLAINGLPAKTITFAGAQTIITVINTINGAFQQPNAPNSLVCVADPTSTQLRIAGTQSVNIIAGSSGTLAKLGLTAGKTNSAGPFPLAKLEGKQVTVPLDGYMALGNDELGGFLVVALQGSIAGFTVVGTFIIEGGAHSITILSDLNSFFTTTGGTTNKVNLYWNAGLNQYLIQNNYGTSTLSCSLIGIGQH